MGGFLEDFSGVEFSIIDGVQVALVLQTHSFVRFLINAIAIETIAPIGRHMIEGMLPIVVDDLLAGDGNAGIEGLIKVVIEMIPLLFRQFFDPLQMLPIMGLVERLSLSLTDGLRIGVSQTFSRIEAWSVVNL
ncbi:MAG: hypothetical protein AAFO77_02280 [Pseudomonadota bacterium]